MVRPKTSFMQFHRLFHQWPINLSVPHPRDSQFTVTRLSPLTPSPNWESFLFSHWSLPLALSLTFLSQLFNSSIGVSSSGYWHCCPHHINSCFSRFCSLFFSPSIQPVRGDNLVTAKCECRECGTERLIGHWWNDLWNWTKDRTIRTNNHTNLNTHSP